MGKEHVVCTCFNVSKSKIENAIREHHLTDLDAISAKTNAGNNCGGCMNEVEDILEAIKKEQ